MTVAENARKCMKLPECVGFTLNEASGCAELKVRQLGIGSQHNHVTYCVP
jgi:hypothetical protein